MAKSDFHIVNIGSLYSILNGLKEKLATKFTAITTALSEKKVKQTAISKTGSSAKTLTSISQNANGDISVEFEDIRSGTTSQTGLVQLENSVSTSTTTAITPNAVKEALDNKSSYIDLTWIIERIRPYEVGTEVQILYEGESEAEATKYNEMINAFFEICQNPTLALAICLEGDDNGNGTWVARNHGYSTFSPVYGCPITLDLINSREYISFRITILNDYKVVYATVNKREQTISWDDISDHPDIPSIKHYTGSSHDIGTLTFDSSNNDNSTIVKCSEESSSNLGIIIPEASSKTSGYVLNINSDGKYNWNKLSYNSLTNLPDIENTKFVNLTTSYSLIKTYSNAGFNIVLIDNDGFYYNLTRKGSETNPSFTFDCFRTMASSTPSYTMHAEMWEYCIYHDTGWSDKVVYNMATKEYVDNKPYYTISEIDTLLASKAPTNHGSTAATYGVGDATHFGHVRVDPELSSISTNPVQNKVVNSALGGKAPTNHASTATTYGVGDTMNYGHVKVDSALSTTSTNPVQNKAIKMATDALSTRIDNIPVYNGIPVVDVEVGNLIPTNPKDYIYKKTGAGTSQFFTFVKSDTTGDTGRIYVQELYSDVTNIGQVSLYQQYIEYNKSTRAIISFPLSTMYPYTFRKTLVIERDLTGYPPLNEKDEVKRCFEQLIPCVMHTKAYISGTSTLIEEDFHLVNYDVDTDVATFYSRVVPDSYDWNLPLLRVYRLAIDYSNGDIICGYFHLLYNSVGTSEINNSAITENKIANSAVSSEKIANRAVTSEKIANFAVDTANLANYSVTSNKINDGEIDAKHKRTALCEWTRTNAVASSYLKITNCCGPSSGSSRTLLTHKISSVLMEYGESMFFIDNTYNGTTNVYCYMEELPKYSWIHFVVCATNITSSHKVTIVFSSGNAKPLAYYKKGRISGSNENYTYTLDEGESADFYLLRGDDIDNKCTLYMQHIWIAEG